MISFKRQSVRACLFGAALALPLANIATAQQTCYRVTDLKALGFTPLSDDIFGNNSAGEAAFTAVVNGEKHAFVWLPQLNYNLAAGLHDLHELANLGPNFTASKAHDISAIGIVAGQATTTEGETRAFVWKLGPPLVTIDLSTFTSPPEIERPTDAWAVSDAAQPVVVGEADGAGCGPQVLGFRTTLDGSNVLSALPPFGDEDITAARDVNNASEPLIVGLFNEACKVNPPPCQPTLGTAKWDPDFAALTDLGLDQGSEGRGNNDNQQIVGWGFLTPDDPCVSRALFWEPPLFAPVILFADVPQDEARAEAINNLALPQIVGSNVTTKEGLIWQRQPPPSTGWDVTNLNDVIAPCANDYEIVQGHDINDSSWIIAVADGDLDTPGLQAHAVLLTPVAQCPSACEGDLDGDGVVGILDLLALLAAWGPCPNPPESCFADLNCDGEVNVFDLLTLIANWGPCPSFIGPPPKSLNNELADAGLSLADWDAFKECMSTGTQAEQDNCLCWMQYYLNGCDGGPRQACSDHDPFTDCVGDLNGDCCVNELDTQILLNQMGPCPAGPGACLGDLNGDCVVDRLDHSDLLTHFGACPGTQYCTSAPPGCGPVIHTQLEDAVTQMGFAEVADYQAHILATSETEAFVCACVLQVLLEAQP